ncbi:hypothetical protein PLESTB_000208000 [Pleodorina starrii]|uniref:Uncharacterized protein n=1 Tax=Pleodorina starrii TaxID=330485 RepID=A0A9W6EYK5_9CHLO|nr:hypothetical protein PLESTB_000208000 [Pleodorina starrii]GLC73409.1 hypothetical protein PLESTF_001372300 [Pleodorina starrii]
MTSIAVLSGLSQRLAAVGVMARALAPGQLADACQPSCSSRSYATQGEDERAAGTRRVFRRPMRYGSKLAMRDPERFRRMKAILGYPDDASAGKVDRVTISTLQTMKYLMSGSENLGMLQGMAAYKVTSLNREVLPLLERTEALIRGKQ